jgi:peptide alpha-N-acetyltransferase
MGDVQGAVAVAEEARGMDLADRFLNNNSVKYLLRAGRVEQAAETMALFTKVGCVGARALRTG